MRAARILAQAKINLFLRVGPRDESGYHQIATLFLRLELADELVVRVGGSSRALDCSGPRLPSAGLGATENNLAFRAAHAYADRAAWPRGFSIELTKNIPVGGGLGGGSSDAGAVLRALDALAPQPLGADMLREIAGSLGSDVPFFASENVAALGTGRGEKLVALSAPPKRDVLLIVPDFAISTADAYRWRDEASPGSLAPIPADLTTIETVGVEHWDRVAMHAHNDFEPVVELRYPKLREFRERLHAKGARIARLSGSGSTVFGVFEGGLPSSRDLGVDALIIPTHTSSRVVQVEVLE